MIFKSFAILFPPLALVWLFEPSVNEILAFFFLSFFSLEISSTIDSKPSDPESSSLVSSFRRDARAALVFFVSFFSSNFLLFADLFFLLAFVAEILALLLELRYSSHCFFVAALPAGVALHSSRSCFSS